MAGGELGDWGCPSHGNNDVGRGLWLTLANNRAAPPRLALSKLLKPAAWLLLLGRVWTRGRGRTLGARTTRSRANARMGTTSAADTIIWASARMNQWSSRKGFGTMRMQTRTGIFGDGPFRQLYQGGGAEDRIREKPEGEKGKLLLVLVRQRRLSGLFVWTLRIVVSARGSSRGGQRVWITHPMLPFEFFLVLSSYTMNGSR